MPNERDVRSALTESRVRSQPRWQFSRQAEISAAMEGERIMSNSTKAACFGVIASSALLVGLGQALATEPANLGAYLPGSTMGATIAAAPPTGLFLTSTAYYFPTTSGNGNTGCGPGCKERYSAVGDSLTLTWGSGWKFLGADYYPTIQTGVVQATATGTPYPLGGGVLDSPSYNNILDHGILNLYVNPLNFSWNLGKGLYVAAGLGFIAPTGSTYAGSIVPDYWTVRPHAAVSYLGEGLNLTLSALYDINTESKGNTGLYQMIARNPATAPVVAALLSGPADPGVGYTSGNSLYVDWTATKKFGNWELGPVGFIRFQTSDDSPGGINPATGSAWTCAQLTAAKLPTCGKDVNIGAGLLVGYDFGPVNMKFIYANAFYSHDAIGSNTGSEFFLKTSFKLWSPEEAPKKTLITK